MIRPDGTRTRNNNNRASREPESQQARGDREEAYARSRVIALIVVFACYQVGASTPLTGEFHLQSSAGNSLLVHLDGLAAYITGIVFIGVGTLAAVRLFRH